MLFDERKHVLGCYGCTQLLRPRSAGMNHIPHRFLAFCSSSTGRIVAESLHNQIPERLEMAYEHGFTKGDKDFVDRKPTTFEISQSQVAS